MSYKLALEYEVYPGNNLISHCSHVNYGKKPKIVI